MLHRAISLRCWLYNLFSLYTCKLRKTRALASDCFYSVSYIYSLIKFVPTRSFIKKKQPQNYKSINLNEVSTQIAENISKLLVCTQPLTQMQLTAYIDSERIYHIFSVLLQNQITVLAKSEATDVLSPLQDRFCNVLREHHAKQSTET